MAQAQEDFTTRALRILEEKKRGTPTNAQPAGASLVGEPIETIASQSESASPLGSANTLQDIEAIIASIKKQADVLASQVGQVVSLPETDVDTIPDTQPFFPGEPRDPMVPQSAQSAITAAGTMATPTAPVAIERGETQIQSIQDAIAELTVKGEERIEALETPDVSALIEEQFATLGITGDLNLLRTITTQSTNASNQLIAVEAREQASLDASSERTGASLAFQTGETQRIQMSFAREKSVLAATISALAMQSAMVSGNINQAKAIAKSYVDAIVFDFQVDRDETAAYLELYETEIASLSKAQQAIFTNLMKEQELILKNARADEKWKAKQLIGENSAALIGIDISKLSILETAELIRDFKITQPGQEGQEGPGIEVPGTTITVDLPSMNASIELDPNNITSQSISQMRGAGMTEGEIFAWLDTNTKLTVSSINALTGGKSKLEIQLRGLFDAGLSREEIEGQIESQGGDINRTDIKTMLDGWYGPTVAPGKGIGFFSKESARQLGGLGDVSDTAFDVWQGVKSWWGNLFGEK